MSSYRPGDTSNWHRLPVDGYEPGQITNWHRLWVDGARPKPVDSYRSGDITDWHGRSVDRTCGEPPRPSQAVKPGVWLKVLIGAGAALATLFLVGAVGSALQGTSDAQGTDGAPRQEASGGAGPIPALPSESPTPRETPSTSPSPSPEPSAELDAPALVGGLVVARVVDGDTVDMADGSTVRLIGIDTPEWGDCGYQEASDRLASLVEGRRAVLQPGKGEDTDRYGRLLRYVVVDGVDAGDTLLREGLAVPRYNSTDGYGWHPRESRYFEVAAAPLCGNSALRAVPAPAAPPPAVGTEPWNMPGPDLDCFDIGKEVRIIGPDYHRLDADGDGWGCEAYG